MSLWKNTDTQAGKPRFLSLGQIDAITVTTGGTAYTPTNGTASVTIAAPPVGGDQATGTVTIVGGVLTSVVITNPGAGYTSAPAVTYTTGGTAGTLEAKTRANADALNGSVVFVDETEAQVATNRAKGIKTPGWMIYKEYVDNAGVTRYKHEVLVVMTTPSATSSDATDDSTVSDTAFSIGTQPSSVSVIAGVATSFTVVAAGATGFQWQLRPATGGQYANVSNGGIYSTATTATLNLSIGTTVGLTGNRYRCLVVNTTTGASATSTAATLTVTA